MYPGNIGSTNQTAPRRVAFRKRSRGEKQNIPNCLRNVAAAMCSCFGCVLRQNQKGELEAASWAREWTMIDRGRCEEPTVLDPVFKTQNSSPGKLRKAFIVFDRNKRAWVSVSFGQVPEVKIITAPLSCSVPLCGNQKRRAIGTDFSYWKISSWLSREARSPRLSFC